MIMIIWMSSLCLCVVFRPGLWPTNTGYCFVSVKKGDGVREGNADQAKNQQASVEEAGHRTKPCFNSDHATISHLQQSCYFRKHSESCSFRMIELHFKSR